MRRRLVAATIVLAIAIAATVLVLWHRGRGPTVTTSHPGSGSVTVPGAASGSASVMTGGQPGAPARHVAGIVVNATGVPLAKAKVGLVSDGSAVRPPVLTGADGRFDLGLIASLDDVVICV